MFVLHSDYDIHCPFKVDSAGFVQNPLLNFEEVSLLSLHNQGSRNQHPNTSKTCNHIKFIKSAHPNKQCQVLRYVAPFLLVLLSPKVYHWHCTAATVHICIKFCGDLMFSNMRIEDQKRQSKIQHCCVTFSPVVTGALRSELNDPTSFPFDNRFNRSTCLPRHRMRHLANLEEAPTPQRLQEKQLG